MTRPLQAGDVIVWPDLPPVPPQSWREAREDEHAGEVAERRREDAEYEADQRYPY